MAELRALLHAKGLGRIADVVQANVKRSIRLTAGAESEEACNRLGGVPNLPADLDWPRRQSHPLAFLVQLDLGALPAIEGLDLPQKGSLFFFHEGGEDAPWGFDPQELGYARVLYSPQPLNECSLRALPSDLEEEQCYRGLEFTSSRVEDSIPDSCDQVIAELGLSPVESDSYEEVWETFHAHLPNLRHRVGGYPDRLQGDLRLEAQLVTNGFYCGDGTATT
jgi:uncharacterized protein YwqG